MCWEDIKVWSGTHFPTIKEVVEIVYHDIHVAIKTKPVDPAPEASGPVGPDPVLVAPTADNWITKWLVEHTRK